MSVLFWLVLTGASLLLVYLFLIITKINEVEDMKQQEEYDAVEKLFNFNKDDTN